MSAPIVPDDESGVESGMPRSLKIFLAVMGVLLAAFAGLHLAGRGLHGH